MATLRQGQSELTMDVTYMGACRNFPEEEANPPTSGGAKGWLRGASAPLKICQATPKPPLFLKTKNITYFYRFKEMYFCYAWRYSSKTDCSDKGNCMLMYFVYDVKMGLVKRHDHFV